jgi:hypothetical protein
MPGPLIEHGAAPTIDRRRSRRSRSLLGGQIIYRDGKCAMRCLILDISDEGALVQPDDMFLCPKTFELKPRLGPARNCETIWRKGNKVGVRFV